MGRASCIVCQHLKTNIQTSFSIKLLHLQFSNFTWSMTCHQGLRIIGGGRVVRRCWVNFQCRGVLLICMIVGQGPTALEVGAGGGCLDIFTLVYPFPPLSPSLWETARYRLKYCLKGPLNPKQPTNQLRIIKLGQVEYPRWPPLLKIAKITKSTFSPEPLDIFG